MYKFMHNWNKEFLYMYKNSLYSYLEAILSLAEAKDSLLIIYICFIVEQEHYKWYA